MTIFGKKLLFKKFKLDFNFYFDTYYVQYERVPYHLQWRMFNWKSCSKVKTRSVSHTLKRKPTLQTERSLGIYGESQASGWTWLNLYLERYREIWLNVTILIYYSIDLTISGSWLNGNYHHQGIIILWRNQFQLSHGAIWVWYSFLQLQT